MYEVDLNYHLRAGMEAAVNDRVVRSHRTISVLPGTESRSAPGKPAGFTDISIHLQDIRERSGDHGPHAVIECKRVAEGEAELCRRYVADGIVDRFVSGKYAGRHRVAFMAGYVRSGSVEAVVRRINQHLSNGRAAECLGSCTVLAEAWARSSSHPRPARPSIELHHAFLTFPAAP